MELLDAVTDAFKANGAAYIKDDGEIKRLRQALFTADGAPNGDCIGKSAHDVAKIAGIDVPKDARILLVKGDLKNQDQVLRRERLCPVSMLYTYGDFAEALEIAKSNLEIDGKGHSVAIHSNNKQNIQKLADSVYVSRVIVNQASNFNAGGGFAIGFAPTTTLGCGTWENNILSENLTYKHLMNVTRIGYPIPGPAPSSQEIWGS